MENKTNIPKLRFPEFSIEWESDLLENIADFSKGKNISKADIVPNGVTECIRYGELYTDYDVVIKDIISKTNIKRQDLVFSKKNDIIIPSSGETQLDIARAACVLKDNIALGGDLNIIRTKHDGVFIAYNLNEKKKFEIAAMAQGNSVVHLYSSQLKTLKLNLPTLSEQQKIASFLNAVDKKLEQLQQKKELLEQYKKDMMQKLFSQQLRFKDDNGNDFPEWEEKELGEITEIKKGEQLNKENLEDFYAYPVINGGVEPSGFTDKFNCESETITISEGGNSCGYVNIIQTNFWLGGHCYAIKLYQSTISKKYIYHCLKFLQKKIMKLRVGSGLPNIQKKDLVKFKIFSPLLEEQTKIADFLTAIDDKIEVTAKELEGTKSFKKGLLQQMFV